MSTGVDRDARRIGDVAEEVGVTTRTIRYYEERGLLRSEGRTKGAHRLYTEADVSRLKELIRLRDLLGLSIEELVGLAEAEEARAALRDRWQRQAGDADRVAIVDESIVLVERQLDLVQARQQTLSEFAAELTGKLQSLKRRRRMLVRG